MSSRMSGLLFVISINLNWSSHILVYMKFLLFIRYYLLFLRYVIRSSHLKRPLLLNWPYLTNLVGDALVTRHDMYSSVSIFRHMLYYFHYSTFKIYMWQKECNGSNATVVLSSSRWLIKRETNILKINIKYCFMKI